MAENTNPVTNDWYSMLDRAKALGLEYATNGISGGETEPEESPLSGEWADRITPKDVVAQLGGDIEKLEHFEIEDILNFWEDGYNSAPWPTRPDTED